MNADVFDISGERLMLVNVNRVEVSDVIAVWPGAIIRCYAPPSECVQVIELGWPGVGHDWIAGQISENE